MSHEYTEQTDNRSKYSAFLMGALVILLCLVATLGACGASGVPGGSLLLIPMACSLLGVDGGIAMQMVGVGFIIGVVQDSLETAINSAGDVLFCATAEYRERIKNGEKISRMLANQRR